MNYIVLTFRRAADGTLLCSSPKNSPHVRETLEEVTGSGLALESMVLGREDDDYDILLSSR